MAVDKSYARLGLFLVVALVVVLAPSVFFIQRLRSRPLLGVVTYTTDNVSGLDVSSPVRFRGGTIGQVSNTGRNQRGASSRSTSTSSSTGSARSGEVSVASRNWPNSAC